jgi:hypothetical protein
MHWQDLVVVAVWMALEGVEDLVVMEVPTMELVVGHRNIPMLPPCQA